MKAAPRPLRFDSAEALNESLAAWCGWFSPEPLAEDLTSLVEQLEAAYLGSNQLVATDL